MGRSARICGLRAGENVNGNLVADPELDETKNGKNLVKVALADVAMLLAILLGWCKSGL